MSSVDATVFEEVLDKHVGHSVEGAPDVVRIGGTGQVDKYLLKYYPSTFESTS